MTIKQILKASLLAKMPEGALRQLEYGGDEDKLIDGIVEALEEGYDAVAALAYVRDPTGTSDLNTLEREYGFLPDTALTEEERRNRIKALKYAKAGSGTFEAMEDALALAGFAQLVVRDGRQSQQPGLVAAPGGEYVVNGFEYARDDGYDIGCVEELSSIPVYPYGCMPNYDPGPPVTNTYPYGCLPLQKILIGINYNPLDNWHLVFFVAEDIQLDANGYVTSMTAAVIPRYYRNLLREVILRIKPLHTWAYLAVNWSDPAGYGFGYFPMGISPHGL